MTRLALTVAVVAALSPRLPAGDFETLHATNANYEFNRHFTLQIHTRLRTNHNATDFFQGRAGPIVFWQSIPRLQAIGGYYYAEQKTAQPSLATIHRVFGGVQFRVIQSEGWTLDWRNLIERHMPDTAQSFARFRTRLFWQGAKPGWRPYASVEGLKVPIAWTTRLAAGVQFAFPGGSQVWVGYECRQYPTVSAGHIITTTFQWQARRAATPSARPRLPRDTP